MNSPDSARPVSIKQEVPEDQPDLVSPASLSLVQLEDLSLWAEQHLGVTSPPGGHHEHHTDTPYNAHCPPGYDMSSWASDDISALGASSLLRHHSDPHGARRPPANDPVSQYSGPELHYDSYLLQRYAYDTLRPAEPGPYLKAEPAALCPGGVAQDMIRYSPAWPQQFPPAYSGTSYLPAVGSWGQQLLQRAPDFPLQSNICNFILGDPEAFPADIIPPSHPLSARGSPFSETCIEDLPNQMSKPLALHHQSGVPVLSAVNEQRSLDKAICHSCDQCGKNFSNKKHLKKHQQIHTGEKPHSCDQCGKNFSNGHNLKKHQQVHTGEKPYPCELCGKHFGVMYHLKRHQLIHTGEKPHSCDHCGKKFIQKENLKTHQSVHTGETPFSCEQCGRRCYTKGDLKVHRRIYTGEKPYHCELCDKHFLL